MSEQTTAPDASADPGLVEFYSSQATLMLAQYRNIEQLLGPTDDYTGPGTHCEVLLRDFLRRYLPSYYRADKGFIHGRRAVGDGTKHCPEIDILIHDNHHFRPILQIEDFVIVQAKAAHGAIQVKRRMDSDKLKDGLKNAVDAKNHFAAMCRGTPRSPDQRFFSAVLFFDEKSPRADGKPSETYRNRIREMFANPESWASAPDIVGSLQNHIFYRDQYGKKLRYVGCPAWNGGANIAVQILLWKITHAIGAVGCDLPFSFPPFPKAEVTFIEIEPPGQAGTAAPATPSAEQGETS